MYEVELKFPVPDPEDVQRRLAGLNARFAPAIDQVDRYFAHPARDFAVTDEALRLRRVGDDVVVTWKGPRIDAATKTRRELELGVMPVAAGASDGAATMARWTDLLEALGFRQVREVAKRRRTAVVQRDGATIEAVLDDVAGLGRFLELEEQATADTIDHARARLGALARELGCAAPERRSYLEMLLAAGGPGGHAPPETPSDIREPASAAAAAPARCGERNATHRLSLGDDRERSLSRTAALVRQVWAGFDVAREAEPAVSREIRELLAAPLPESPSPAMTTLDQAAGILDCSLAQSRPRFLAYIGSSGLEVAAIADFLAASYDVNMAVDARAASLLEEQASRWLGEFIGYPHGHGLFTSGGTVSNVTALAAARERASPGVRETGIGSPLAVYCSVEAHHSNTRAIELLGLGRRSIRPIPIDSNRRMRVDLLEAAILRDLAAGTRPLAVIGTAGTTLTGAVDPLRAIAAVAARYGIWMHVDAAYGGPAAATVLAAPLFDGLALADSVTVDAHKWLFVPKACGVLLVRDPTALTAAFAHDEAYMPHEDTGPNPVDATLEYSRPLRALKLWLAFKTHGAEAFREAIAGTIRLARATYDRARATAGFRTLDTAPQLSVVPLAHVPPGVADVDAHQRRLCRAIERDGRVFLSPAVIDGRTWLRPCFTNFRTQPADIDVLFTVIADLSDRIGRGR